MDKVQLRKLHRTRRDNTDIKQRDAASKAIFQKLIQDININKAKTVMTYISMGSEPDTFNFTSWLFANRKKVVVPVVLGQSLGTSYISSFCDLEKSSFGIPEPRSTAIKECKPNDIDVVIVPGIVFDKKGYRVGYGGGYYDRFLPSTKAVTIGLCYDFCIVDAIQAQQYDIPVDYVITNG
ncbi:MAG: 5-formyltetrahydrofolate cyclo-ligase [Clostridiaceae bacterium]|nr:5-formyltetrahydrofolate cyclo-ligase [Clostridiaceae bacterium]